jgi:hypothetical protein
MRRSLGMAVAVVGLTASVARAELPPQSNEQATLIVEGVVRESFQSVRPTQVDYLYEIEVRSASVGQAPERALEGAVPGQGEVIYVHGFRRRPDAPPVPGPVGYRDLPAEQESIRAYLYPRNSGGWQFAYPVGFERIGRGGPGEPFPGTPPGDAPPRRLGIMVMPASVGDRPGLRVTAVTPGTPGGRGGLEPGDIILEADGTAIRTLNDLTSRVARAAGKLRLLIRNVRNGRIETLEIDLGG